MPVQQTTIAEDTTPIAGLSRPLRVALVVHTFEIGGIERHVARLASRLDRRKFQPLIICLARSGQAAQWLEVDDVPIIELHKRPRNDLRLIFRLARVLRDEHVDLVHSHNWGTLVETALARRWARTPVHVHAERGTVLGDIDGRGLKARLRALAMAWAVGRASALVSNAQAVARKAAAAARLPVEHVRVIPNGLDLSQPRDERERERVRRQCGIPQDVPVVGSVGRLVAVKNFSSAIEALSRLTGCSNSPHLLLVGDGPERASLEELARTRNVRERVHFAGWHEDVLPFLGAMDIYLNCSLSEGMSQSLVEAMSLGLPSIATDVGDNGLLVGGEGPCGLVVPRGDAAALADALRRLTTSADLRRDLGRNALDRFSARYHIEGMIARYETLYGELWSSAIRA